MTLPSTIAADHFQQRADADRNKLREHVFAVSRPDLREQREELSFARAVKAGEWR